MPIYEFLCEECKGDFEELCRRGTDHVKCPVCGGKNVHRKISSFAISSGSKSEFLGSSSAASTRSGCSSCSSRSCSTCH